MTDIRPMYEPTAQTIAAATGIARDEFFEL